MSVELLRKLLNVLVILSLAVPGLGMRACCCSRAANYVNSSVSRNASTLPPCCAKRLAAAQAARDSQPALKSKCCCGDVRWSHVVAKALPTRVDESQFSGSLSANFLPATIRNISPVWVTGREDLPLSSAPPDERRVRLCRWQI